MVVDYRNMVGLGGLAR